VRAGFAAESGKAATGSNVAIVGAFGFGTGSCFVIWRFQLSPVFAPGAGGCGFESVIKNPGYAAIPDLFDRLRLIFRLVFSLSRISLFRFRVIRCDVRSGLVLIAPKYCSINLVVILR